MGEQNQKGRKTRKALYESHNQSELGGDWICDDHMRRTDDTDHICYGTCNNIWTIRSYLERRWPR